MIVRAGAVGVHIDGSIKNFNREQQGRVIERGPLRTLVELGRRKKWHCFVRHEDLR